MDLPRPVHTCITNVTPTPQASATIMSWELNIRGSMQANCEQKKKENVPKELIKWMKHDLCIKGL